MKLYTLGVPYTLINRDILMLRTRAAVIELLRMCGGTFALDTLKHGTPYAHRAKHEAWVELAQHDLVSLDDKGIASLNEVPLHKRAELPSYIPWNNLSLTELKVIIALYVEARHQRAPYFSWTGRRDDLAKVARVSRQSVGAALDSLAVKGLLKMKTLRDQGSRWTRGTEVQLLDTQSGCSLNDLAYFFRDKLNELGPLTLYKAALRPQLDELHGWVRGMRVTCPFCLDHNRTLRVTATEDEDLWKCFECGKSGDSAKLCALRSFHLWKEPEFNLSALAAYMGIDPTSRPSLEELSNATCN